MQNQNKKITKAALWVKKTKAGNDYYSVSVTLADGSQEWVNLFWNKKSNEKQPDFKTIEDKPKDNKQVPPPFEENDSIPF